MRIRNIVSLVTIVCLVIALLTACGRSEEPSRQGLSGAWESDWEVDKISWSDGSNTNVWKSESFTFSGNEFAYIFRVKDYYNVGSFFSVRVSMMSERNEGQLRR